MIDRRLVGAGGALRRVRVEAGQLRSFAQAIGETDPVYTDEQAARAAGHRALPAPLTFGIVLESLAPDPAVSLDALKIPVEKLLHGEQEFRCYRTIYAGDMITLETRIANIYEKKGGVLEFVEWQTMARNDAGELMHEARNVCVIRHRPRGAERE